MAITLAATALLSFALGRSLRATRELALIIGFAIAADVVAALAVTLAFDEMRRVAEFAIPRAIFTETVGGLQLLAIAGGLAIGYVIGRPRVHVVSPSDTGVPERTHSNPKG